MASQIQSPRAPIQKVVQAAATVARNEVDKTVYDIQSQIGLPTREAPPQPEVVTTPKPLVQTISESGPTINREEIAMQEKVLLANLEAQLAQLRQRRDQEMASYNESQQRAMEASTQSIVAAPVEAPTGKVRKALGQAKKAITTIMTRKQSESKQGSGKG